MEGVLTGEEEPEDLIRLAPAFAHSSRTPRVGPTGLPRCGGAPSTPGRLGYRGRRRMKGIEADDKCFHLIAYPQRTRDHDGLHGGARHL